MRLRGGRERLLPASAAAFWLETLLLRLCGLPHRRALAQRRTHSFPDSPVARENSAKQRGGNDDEEPGRCRRRREREEPPGLRCEGVLAREATSRVRLCDPRTTNDEGQTDGRMVPESGHSGSLFPRLLARGHGECVSTD